MAEEDRPTKTNHTRVRDWMLSIGQDCPESFQFLPRKTLKLRRVLLEEESSEALEALSDLLVIAGDTRSSAGEFLYYATEALKELADTLVVTYGAFAAMGVVADGVLGIVMDANEEKEAQGRFRADGKLIVPEVEKERIKAAAHDRIKALVKRGLVGVPE